MVNLLDNGNTAFVQVRLGTSEVCVFQLSGVKYLRTFADGDWSDHLLLSLPTF
ncbi:hypothetical protein BH09ACT7_BH09ACT7_24180 [soil metagenome]